MNTGYKQIWIKIRQCVESVRERAFTKVPIDSLVFFRIAFGLLLVWEVSRYFPHDWIAIHWLQPTFLFKYYGFSWIHPWPGNWLYVHWGIVGFLALLIAAGFLYRVSAFLFFLSYTYFFLLDEARYVNHTYLICLLGFLLIFVPANRALSIDAWLNPKIRSRTTPAWTVWILRLQIGVVYFYGGVAKIAPDWLRGEPMRTRMAHNVDFPVIGRFFREEWAVYVVSYGGLLLDLAVVPMLLWRRTRVAAFFLAMVFHLINARAFDIGIFPWLAICATTLFLSPSWPRKIVRHLRLTNTEAALPNATSRIESRYQQSVILTLASLYVAIQLLVPLRYLLYGTSIEWSSLDHRFSWRMMLVNRRANSYFYVTDPNSERTRQVRPGEFLTGRQTAIMPYQPDMAVQFAHYLARVIPQTGPKPLQVEARIFVSINGRKPELFIDPNVDLAAEQPPIGRPTWLSPIHSALPAASK